MKFMHLFVEGIDKMGAESGVIESLPTLRTRVL
jgi:hypothetical protein